MISTAYPPYMQRAQRPDVVVRSSSAKVNTSSATALAPHSILSQHTVLSRSPFQAGEGAAKCRRRAICGGRGGSSRWHKSRAKGRHGVFPLLPGDLPGPHHRAAVRMEIISSLRPCHGLRVDDVVAFGLLLRTRLRGRGGPWPEPRRRWLVACR